LRSFGFSVFYGRRGEIRKNGCSGFKGGEEELGRRRGIFDGERWKKIKSWVKRNVFRRFSGKKGFFA
jgi:hypothetical protein